jgi:hypothetical protein
MVGEIFYYVTVAAIAKLLHPAGPAPRWRILMATKYHGKMRRWMPAIKRWRKAGLSWTSVGRLLEAFGVWTKVRYTGNRAEVALALEQLAWTAHKQMATEHPRRR